MNADRRPPHPPSVAATIRRLDLRERAIWAVGPPAKAAPGLILSALMMWLGYSSVGLAAAVAVLTLLACVWGVPFAWSGRLRLVVDSTGVTDIRRFRTLHHPWNGGALAWDRQGGQHGISLTVPGEPHPVPLLAGWCADRESAFDLLQQLQARGWPVILGQEPASRSAGAVIHA